MRISDWSSDVCSSDRIPSGQSDAALALGLSRWRSFCLVLLPQAARAMMPPMTTQYTQIVKNSSVVMLVALQELTFMTQRIERSEEHTSELQSLMRISYAVFCLKKKKKITNK